MSETGELTDHNNDRTERLDDILIEEENEVRSFAVAETVHMGIFVYFDDICLYWQSPQPVALAAPATPAFSPTDSDVGVLCYQVGTEPLSRVIE